MYVPSYPLYPHYPHVIYFDHFRSTCLENEWTCIQRRVFSSRPPALEQGLDHQTWQRRPGSPQSWHFLTGKKHETLIKHYPPVSSNMAGIFPLEMKV